MATAKQRAWRAKFASMYGGKKRIRKVKRSRGVTTMERRRFGRRRSGGLGMGRLLSTKNILYTVAGAALLPRFVGIDPQIGGAVGGFLGGGPIGAVAGYFLGAPVANATSGILGGSSSGGTILY